MPEKCPTCGRSMVFAADPPGVLPVVGRPPFDWTPYIQYAIRGVILLLAGISAYYAPSASKHAETAAVQSKENGKELKAHGEKLRHLNTAP